MSDYKFRGSNNFSLTRFIYYQRLKYKLKAFENVKHPSVVKNFDFAELTYYGRVRPDMYAVRPLKNFIKPITIAPTAGKTVMALDFVVDAFSDMVRHFRTAADMGVIGYDEPFLSELRPKLGYQDPDMLYKNHLDEMMDAFTEHFAKKYRKKIKNVKDFVDYLIPFAKKMTSTFPITYSSWQVSKLSSPFTSGLCIDIARLKIDNDKQKELHFLNNKNLNFYLDTCKAHGFYVSLNAPHILYADVNSAAMKKYMVNHGVTNSHTTFSNKYEKIFLYDVEYLKTALFGAYNKFVVLYKNENEISYCNKSKIVQKIFIRKPIEYNIYNNIINTKYMIKLYNNIKNIELDEPFAQADIQKYTQKAIKLLQVLDKDTAINYINNQYRSVSHSRPGSSHDFLKKFKAQAEHRDKNKGG